MEEKSWFDEMASILEQDTIGVKAGIYGLGLIGCCYAVRSVRPFSKFRAPKDIPRSFFNSRMKLSGEVIGMRFLPDSAAILVDHRPVMFGQLRGPGALPVKIEGINITSNGVCWLQTIVRGDNVDFVLMEPKEMAVSCIVHHKTNDIAKRLLSLGFASVAPFNTAFGNDKEYLNYYKELLNLESRAEKKKVGMWWDEKLYSSWAYFIIKQFKRAVPSPSKPVKLVG